MPGILVSNGREVVRTDAQERYALPIGEEGVVFVIKPTGYAPPRDADNLPRFTYLHQPTGTPASLGLRYEGVAPTGPLPASIDFGLRRVDEPTRFEVILFTDPQPQTDAELDFVRDTAIARVVGTQAALGLTLGDIAFDDLAAYPRYTGLIGQVGIPWYHIGGNHDLNFEAPDAVRSRETFKRVFGAPYYAFEHGGTLFLMLDNVFYRGADRSRPGAAGPYEGRFGERQLAFVENVLRETPKDRLVVAAMHIPLRTDLGPDDPAVSTVDRDAFLALLAGRPSLTLAGHTHTTEHHYLGASQDQHHHVLTAVSGSWWSGPYDRRGIAAADSRDGTPNGFHVLSIDGARYTTRLIPASEPEERRMRITFDSRFHGLNPEVARDYRVMQLLGSPIRRAGVGATDLVVNVFDAGPRTTATYTLPGRAPAPLARVRRADPFVTEIFERHPATKKPWVKAEPSTHIFVARLPRDLAAGSHRLTVDVVDEYGRRHSDGVVLEVA